MYEAYTALISLPEVTVRFLLFVIFHCRHLYLYLHTYYSLPLVSYSKWLQEQFCNLFLYTLYIISVQ